MLNDFLILLALFFGSIIATVVLVRTKRLLVKKRLNVTPGSKVRLVTDHGIYYCKVVGVKNNMLVMSPPLSTREEQKWRVGGDCYAQVTDASGVRHFRTRLKRISSEDGDIYFEIPDFIRTLDRRSEIRQDTLQGASVSVNGEPSQFIDVSASGAKILSRLQFAPGDEIVLEWGDEHLPVDGWVLECKPIPTDTLKRNRIRVQFKELFDGIREAQ